MIFRFLILLLSLSGCATLEQYAVGRSDRLSGAPFFVDYAASSQPFGPVLALPISLDATTAAAYTSSGRAEALAPLLEALNDALAGSGCCMMGTAIAAEGAPDLYVGSLEGDDAPAGTGIERMPHEIYPPMLAHLVKPRGAWLAALRQQAANHDASRVVLIHLSFTQYPKAQRGRFGKQVVLGTGYETPIRFLSAIDQPVEVIQLTGLLLDADGKVLRGGAQGMVSQDSEFLLQAADIRREIGPLAIQQLTNHERRDDLPGAPLKWQAALDQLLANLLGRQR